VCHSAQGLDWEGKKNTYVDKAKFFMNFVVSDGKAADICPGALNEKGQQNMADLLSICGDGTISSDTSTGEDSQTSPFTKVLTNFFARLQHMVPAIAALICRSMVHGHRCDIRIYASKYLTYIHKFVCLIFRKNRGCCKDSRGVYLSENSE